VNYDGFFEKDKTNTILFSYLICLLLLPLIVVMLVYNCVGTKLNGLVLGIVNNEVANYSDCFNPSLETYKVDRHECSLRLLSCRFIGELDQNVMELVRVFS
jgi:hypothetical protein